MSEITKAIEARRAQINQLQADIETLRRAVSIMGGRAKAPAKATPARQPTTRSAQPKTKRKRRPWSAAARKAMSKKVKASWAKRKRARR